MTTQFTTPQTMTVTIGLTQSEVDEKTEQVIYSSFMGYRAGARQEEIVLTVPATGDTVEDVAEAVFVASNAPYEVEGLAAEIRAAMRRYLLAGGEPTRSLSTGDTVTLTRADGSTSRVACENLGWKRIA